MTFRRWIFFLPPPLCSFWRKLWFLFSQATMAVIIIIEIYHTLNHRLTALSKHTLHAYLSNAPLSHSQMICVRIYSWKKAMLIKVYVERERENINFKGSPSSNSQTLYIWNKHSLELCAASTVLLMFFFCTTTTYVFIVNGSYINTSIFSYSPLWFHLHFVSHLSPFFKCFSFSLVKKFSFFAHYILIAFFLLLCATLTRLSSAAAIVAAAARP